MVTGCAPIFLLGLIGVAAGSWMFGSHWAARLTALGLLALFLLYFALLNWTAQTRLRSPTVRRDEEPNLSEAGGAHRVGGERLPFTKDDRAEWLHYLRTEGRILWFAVAFLLLVLLALLLRR